MTAPHCNEPLAVLDISSPASRGASRGSRWSSYGQPVSPNRQGRRSFGLFLFLLTPPALLEQPAGLLSFNRREHIQKVRVRGGTTFPSELLETPDLIGLQLRVLRQRLQTARHLIVALVHQQQVLVRLQFHAPPRRSRGFGRQVAC